MRSRLLCTPTLLALAVLASACRPDAKPDAEAARKPADTKFEPKVDRDAIGKAGIKAVKIGDYDESLPAPTCAAPSGDWYLHLSDIHLGTTVAEQDPSGDTSVALWQATKDALRRHIGGENPPRFILYTGDLPDHSPDHGDLHTANVAAVLADLKALAGSIPLIYMPGNNDSLDWDYAAFTSSEGQTPLAAGGWSGPTLNVASTGDPAVGYASASPMKGLRVVALNTVVFTAKYPCARQPEGGTCTSSQDEQVGAQLDWLEAELKAAAEAGDKVLLAMHVPPGIDAYASPATMWKDAAWQDRFLEIVDASPATIVSLAYGHTHLDELRRLYDASGVVELVALSAPGITPGHGNNPGFKAIRFAEDFTILDATTWYASASSPDAGDFAYRPGNCYRYTDVFSCAPKTDLSGCLAAMQLCELDQRMDGIYKVRRGTFAAGSEGYYDTAPGIEVRPGGAAPATCPE